MVNSIIYSNINHTSGLYVNEKCVLDTSEFFFIFRRKKEKATLVPWSIFDLAFIFYFLLVNAKIQIRTNAC